MPSPDSPVDLAAFREKRERQKEYKKQQPKEGGLGDRSKINSGDPRDSQLTAESKALMDKILPDKLDAVIKTMRSVTRVSKEVQTKTEEVTLAGMSGEEIVDFINRASLEEIEKKPILFRTAFGKLIEYKD